MTTRYKTSTLLLSTVCLFCTSNAVAQTPSDILEPLKARDPYTYVIGAILLAGISVLIGFLRVLWNKNEKQQVVMDDLHESKLQFALDAGATMKEAVQIVQAVHDKLEPMAQGEAARREFQNLITQKIELMDRNINDKLKDIHDAVRDTA